MQPFFVVMTTLAWYSELTGVSRLPSVLFLANVYYSNEKWLR